MNYLTKKNGIAIDLISVEKKLDGYKSFFEDKEITKDTIEYYLGVLVSDNESVNMNIVRTLDVLIEQKNLLPLHEVSEYTKLGREVINYIERMYFYFTINTVSIGGIYASLLTPLYYALSIYKGEENDYPIYKNDDNMHVFFEEDKPFNEIALMRTYSRDFDKYTNYSHIKSFPIGFLTKSDSSIKREEKQMDCFEERMKHYYHMLLCYHFLKEKVVTITKKKKVFIPFLNDLTNYLTRHLIVEYEKGPETLNYQSRIGISLSNLKKSILNVGNLNKIYNNVPFYEVFEKKTDIFIKYEKSHVNFIYELEIDSDTDLIDITRLSNKDAKGKKTYTTYLVYDLDMKIKGFEDTNPYSLLHDKDKRVLHYVNRLNKDDSILYKLKNDEWVEIKQTSYKKVSFKYLKKKTFLEEDYHYKYDSYYSQREFKEEFGFNPLPPKNKIDDEIVKMIISN